MSVTKRQAEQVFKAVQKKYASYLDGVGELDQPKLIKDWDWGWSPIKWAVVWESGPFEWALLASGGGFDEETYLAAVEIAGAAEARRMSEDGKFNVEPLPVPKGVWLEPVNGWSFGIYAY